MRLVGSNTGPAVCQRKCDLKCGEAHDLSSFSRQFVRGSGPGSCDGV